MREMCPILGKACFARCYYQPVGVGDWGMLWAEASFLPPSTKQSADCPLSSLHICLCFSVRVAKLTYHVRHV